MSRGWAGAGVGQEGKQDVCLCGAGEAATGVPASVGYPQLWIEQGPLLSPI